ncbi:MAG: hypothetical protein MK108_09725 [Mariniblastus sp.]|nr:hypothetical protein [Mariniblastus sp.]
MGRMFESIRRFEDHLALVQRRRYGLIEIRDGQFFAIHFRPWPRIITALEVNSIGRWKHRHLTRDRCLLYFNQPIRHRNFLALKYIFSSQGSSCRTLHQATKTLDCVARIKRSDAIVTEVFNRRISDRLMRRLGWVPHCPERSGHHYIKRFYGQYPAYTDNLAASE